MYRKYVHVSTHADLDNIMYSLLFEKEKNIPSVIL